ncbi:LOW QUALITY PROTEIN: ras association domain-containing protein 10 [Narcine bancroftii]|uniref:LOW QUALITY PROTEIN: ras association domain-containing protein 10 n=1 Tax=Narcine bancroftii TaxID=1343680 RepID=UPI003831FD63
MEGQESSLSVWVLREEKLVSGLSRRTTCADVIAALLREAATSNLLSGAPDTYCLVEKRRGFERTLPNRTKMLRLWAAWGEERGRVTLVLEKRRAALDRAGARSAQARVVASKESPGRLRGAAGATLAMPRDKQRRVVRKAFRKLARMKRAQRRESGAKERMETLVHVVLSQDHTIRQQLERLRELDGDIESCEARVHLARMREHGANYLQDTYLEEGEASGQAPEAQRLREQLDASVGTGLRLSSELRACGQELERCRGVRERQRGEVQRLLRELRDPGQDSDTGLSSMNSPGRRRRRPISESQV